VSRLAPRNAFRPPSNPTKWRKWKVPCFRSFRFHFGPRGLASFGFPIRPGAPSRRLDVPGV